MRQLLSERWNAFLENQLGEFGGGEEEIPDRVLNLIDKYDMEKFNLNITEAHMYSMDEAVELADDYELRFIIGEENERIVVCVSHLHMPCVMVGESTIQFPEYFEINSYAAAKLGELFFRFASSIASYRSGALESANGYSWEGMKKITKQEALGRFNNGLEVYRLYDDGTEALVESLGEIEDENFHDYDFGFSKV